MTAPSSVRLFAPDSNAEALAESTFPFDRFLGTWHVIASTLPMWKGKQQVTLTYSCVDRLRIALTPCQEDRRS